jgi:autotransporter-associated beta strand protein
MLYAGSATWRVHPPSNDWNTAANWRPTTVPSAAGDTARFAVSDVTDVSLTVGIQIGEVIFSPGASSFTIRTDPGVLNFAGAGITNDSGVTQNFIANQHYMGLAFHHQATAGTQTVFTAENLGVIVFHDEATAGFGTFIIEGNSAFMDAFSNLDFYDNSSAANGIFINVGGSGFDAEGGITFFYANSTAANGTFMNAAATDGDAFWGGITIFGDYSRAGSSTITNQGGVLNGGIGGLTEFADHSTATNATIICDGGQVAGAYPGAVIFFESASAGSATLIANGGVSVGGNIFFNDASDGGQSRVELFGNGKLDLTFRDSPGLSIGSLEADGIVLLDIHNLTVGTNDLSTTFSGVIQGSGSLTKVGAGTLTLAGANTYSGGTTVGESFLKVANTTGSATGSGPVEIDGGILGGSGIISGPVIVGNGSSSGAFLAPGTGSTTLTLQSALTFKADGAYTWRVNTRSARADKVIANGVTTESGARFDPIPRGNAQLPVGTSFTAIRNTSGMPITGTFTNLPDGSTITFGNNTFQASYQGGDGNDLTLTVVP